MEKQSILQKQSILEKQSIVVNNGGGVRGGGIKLPIGYRFRPTDEELIVHYLKRGAANSMEKSYFFCKGIDPATANDHGYWKHTGKPRHILSSSSSKSQLVGMRRSLVFRTHGEKKQVKGQTKWVMHEFCLLGLVTIPFTNQISMVKVGDWVLCSVFQKKKKKHTKTKKKCSPNPVDSMDIRMDELSDAGPAYEERGKVDSLPCSSGITDLSCTNSSSNVSFSSSTDHQR
ncbi:NAC domain-containing protein 92 [Linum perenne]